MNFFITAGNTQTPVDRVRCITNIFSGKTGARIAVAAHDHGHHVTFATSHPEVLNEIDQQIRSTIRVLLYRTFDELEEIMAGEISSGRYDCVIHAAAVNDYHVAGNYGLSPGTVFDEKELRLQSGTLPGKLIDVSKGKIKGNYPEVWMRLLPAPKLVDKIRNDWKFKGQLVKFKLEVGVSESELLKIGEASRIHSCADWLVANTLEEMNQRAYLLGEDRKPEKIDRAHLANRLIDVLSLR